MPEEIRQNHKTAQSSTEALDEYDRRSLLERLEKLKIAVLYNGLVRQNVEHYAARNEGAHIREIESAVKANARLIYHADTRDKRDEIFNNLARETQQDMVILQSLSFLSANIHGNEETTDPGQKCLHASELDVHSDMHKNTAKEGKTSAAPGFSFYPALP